MKKMIEQLEDVLRAAFSDCGYEERFGMLSVSNRPDRAFLRTSEPFLLRKLAKHAGKKRIRDCDIDKARHHRLKFLKHRI